MKRFALYSTSKRPHGSASLIETDVQRTADARAEADMRGGARGEAGARGEPEPDARAPTRRRGRRVFALAGAYERLLLLAVGALLALVLAAIHNSMTPAVRTLTQRDIDAAVLHTLQTKPLPSRAAKAADIVRPSVVRVRRLAHGDDGQESVEIGVGSGVVIVDSGLILTSLHVVAGAERIGVVFFDGLESDAAVVSVQPEQDLAVLQAKTLPDDLVPATLRSTRDLVPGDDVIAVGFPFGIGPSVSSGVISGLGREYRSPDGKQALRNLIQFDAAANPGSSGGPLVTSEGEVVGIVTAILNPTDHQVFIGIGFAVPIESAAGAVGLSPF